MNASEFKKVAVLGGGLIGSSWATNFVWKGLNVSVYDVNDGALRDTRGTGEGFLYRYRDLVGKRAEWVRQILIESKLYFASPADFNDPFDCKARYRTDISPEHFQDRANALMRERGMPRKERRRALRSTVPIRQFASNVAEGFQKEIDRIGVLSLSSTHENILLWSHYACGHRGVCLQFRVSVDLPFLGGALDVHYSHEMPTPTLFGEDPYDRVKAILLTKAIDWKYEREWRVIQPDSRPGPRSFHPSLLSGLILGANISPQNRDMVLSWVEQRRDPLSVYTAERDPEHFSLVFRSLST